MLPDKIDPAIEQAIIKKDIEILTEKVEKLSNDVENLVKAWNTATYVVVFVKWLAGAGAAVAVVYTFFEHLFRK